MKTIRTLKLFDNSSRSSRQSIWCRGSCRKKRKQLGLYCFCKDQKNTTKT